MAYDNTVVIAGNVTRDPEVKFTKSGVALAKFGLAWNNRRKVGDEWEDDPKFFDVTCWAELAEHVGDTVEKGQRVIVTGLLDQQTWETDEGDKRSKVEIKAEDVAPSLKWATAEVTKAGKSGGSKSSSKPSKSKSDDYDYDEEPFRMDAGSWTPGWFGEYPTRILPG